MARMKMRVDSEGGGDLHCCMFSGPMGAPHRMGPFEPPATSIYRQDAEVGGLPTQPLQVPAGE